MLGFLVDTIENYLVVVNEESIACIDFFLRELPRFIVIISRQHW